jgi:hypothetical protein
MIREAFVEHCIGSDMDDSSEWATVAERLAPILFACRKVSFPWQPVEVRVFAVSAHRQAMPRRLSRFSKEPTKSMRK